MLDYSNYIMNYDYIYIILCIKVNTIRYTSRPSPSLSLAFH